MDELRKQYESKLEHIEGIQVTATPLYDTIVSGISVDLPVLFRIMAGKKKIVTKRKPLNLAIVLDRSGSMQGNKLEYSKRAIKQLISQLDKKDRLHFVVYDDRVDTILTNVNSSKARDSLEKIDAVTSRGCTDLFAGVQEGVDLLVKYHCEGMVDAVFLFSDGQANNGIQGTENIGSCIKELHSTHGIHFTTFGIGADYDEKLMSSIARVGKGNYFFIDDMERIPDLVQKAYSGFTNVLAENLVLKVRGLNNSMLKSISGCDNIIAGKSYDIMREYGFYQLVATVAVAPSADFVMVNSTPILAWQLTFNDLYGQQITQTGKVEVKLVDGFDVEQKPSPEVVVYNTMVECGALNEEATLAIKGHNRVKAIAAKKRVIAKYEQVLDFDDYNLVKVLLNKERKALEELEREGITDRTTKMCSYASIATPSRYVDRCSYEDPEEEDDEDMGFGLFS